MNSGEVIIIVVGVVLIVGGMLWAAFYDRIRGNKVANDDERLHQPERKRRWLLRR